MARSSYETATQPTGTWGVAQESGVSREGAQVCQSEPGGAVSVQRAGRASSRRLRLVPRCSHGLCIVSQPPSLSEEAQRGTASAYCTDDAPNYLRPCQAPMPAHLSLVAPLQALITLSSCWARRYGVHIYAFIKQAARLGQPWLPIQVCCGSV